MTDKTTEALELAGLVEASVEECIGDDGMVAVIPFDLYNDLMAAIREARAEQDHIADAGKVIAEPVKQEPVAWAYIDADGSFMDALDRQHGAYQTPLYAAPVSAKRECVELTDDEIENIRANCIETPIDLADRPYGWSIYFARAVVAAFKEKNK